MAEHPYSCPSCGSNRIAEDVTIAYKAKIITLRYLCGTKLIVDNIAGFWNKKLESNCKGK